MRPPGSPDSIWAEQVRSSYEHLPLIITISVLNSALIGFVLASDVAEARILGWFSLIVGLSAIRLGLWYAHARLDVGPSHSRWWARLAAAGAFASGALWGSSVFVFAPLGEVDQLFLALVISGMCAGAATVHSAWFPAVLAFIAPGILPLTLNFFTQGYRLHIVSGIMAGVFGISLCIASLRFQRWFRENTSARLTLARQTREINAANAHLQSEMEQHRATEMKLHHAQKMEAVGRLTAGIAHDFNNLLMAIGGAAEVLAGRVGLDTTQRRLVERVLQSVERGANLTRQLLVFGRKQVLLPRFVDINEMLLGMEALLVSTLGGYGLLRLELDPTQPPAAFVDANQLENSLLNLVINARDAMQNSGVVTIKTAKVELDGIETGAAGLAGEFVMISVSDTGTGMTEQVRLQAFDPFFSTKEPGKGSGLGLSQVYGLVQQSGGTVRLDSRPGAGTTVSIFLPRAPPSQASPASTPTRSADETASAIAPATPRANRRILLLDDDEQVRENLAEMLIEAGYSVASFATVPQALDELSRPNSIDLIMVDYAMPIMRGDQFAAKARSQHPRVPVLFVTGYAETDALQTERWVLRKPFKVAALISTVEEAMRIAA